MFARWRSLRALPCALVLLTTVLAETSRADEDPRESAAAHYARGIELANQGLYEAALEQFNDAYAKSPHFAVLYNIGQAQITLGRPMEAIEALSNYLRDGAEKVPLSRREQVQAQIGLLESRLAELSITTGRSGISIRVDGRDVGRTPLYQPIRLAAGTHTINASSPDGAEVTRVVTIGEAERQRLEMGFATGTSIAAAGRAASIPEEAPGIAPPPGPLLMSTSGGPPPEPWYFHGTTMRRMATVTAGVGALCGGAALAVYLANRGNYDNWRAGAAALANDTLGSAAYRAQATSDNAMASSLNSANHAIVVLSIASGALIAAGASLFLVDRAHRHPASELSFGWGGGSSANLSWRWTW